MDNLRMEALNRIKSKRNHFIKYGSNTEKKQNDKNSKYIRELFTRTLISVIFVLLCAIYTNLSDKNLIFFKNHFFNETLAFTKINSLYTKYFGEIVPESLTKSIPVFETGKKYTNLTPENNSYRVELTSNVLPFLESGVVVFLGEKEGYGKTMIVQGIDGVDIWYSNLENYNVTMYDYVEKDKIVGEFKENKALLTFIENGQNISYENYLS